MSEKEIESEYGKVRRDKIILKISKHGIPLSREGILSKTEFEAELVDS